MIQHHLQSEKPQNQLLSTLTRLKIGQHLRQAGIRKAFGVPSLAVFQIIFRLVFERRSLLQLLQGPHSQQLPGKDVVYRFLNESRYNWRRFLNLLSHQTIEQLDQLTSAKRIRVFIIDDSVVSRNRSKKVELLARVYDHVLNRFVRGYSMLTLGWSDGYSFVPIDFSLLSSAKEKNRYCEEQSGLDKRTSGYKRRQEAVTSKPEGVIQMLDRAVKHGISADYVLMDSWYTQVPLMQRLKGNGFDVIGMVKNDKRRYCVNDQHLTLSEIYAQIPRNPRSDIQGSVKVTAKNGLALKLIFIRNRNNRKTWLAILTTDVAADDAEVVRIYGMRWSIETFFKMTKSYLKLGSEFHGRSFDLMISHTTIVFARYLTIEWERRQENDDRTFGGMFFLFVDEVTDMDLKTALYQLMAFVLTLISSKLINGNELCQFYYWFDQLPKYIKGLIAPLGCET